MNNMKQQIEDLIDQFIADFSTRGQTRWGKPLIGYARADDPLFISLKDYISPTHALPRDFLDSAETVICYFLPFTEAVINSNKTGRYSSKLWGVAYIETNRLINKMNEFLKDRLISSGYKAAFVPATHNFNKEKLISDWSHRSAAYIAGLGTFGLNHMLITANGCCGRVGSIITSLKVEPTRRYDRELCLHKINGSCGRCVKKCVNNALAVDGLDRHRCYQMLLENGERLRNLGDLADVCGKCLVEVPCSTGIPLVEEG